MKELRILLKNTEKSDSHKLKTYESGRGYESLRKALLLQPQDIINEVKASGLRGRGGAGFPTGRKWEFISDVKEKPVYLICNADEGEPGTFKDRVILEKNPHLLIEGMVISGFAIRANLGFIYIRGEFSGIAGILEGAIDEAMREGLLGKNIMGSGFEFDIHIYKGAGSYVCGEETALIESLEGKRGQPRLKPPYPAKEGLYKCPTIVNNVETLACIPSIVREGALAFASIGKHGNTGTKLFPVSGDVEKPGCYEYPMGVPLHTLIYEAAGGIRNEMELKAVIPGGLSTPVLTALESNIDMDYDSLARAGSMLGSGGIIVLSKSALIPAIAHKTAAFYADESCGQCTPCREGLRKLRFILEKLVNDNGNKESLNQIERLCKYIRGASLCPLADAAVLPMNAFIGKFRPEFEAMLR